MITQLLLSALVCTPAPCFRGSTESLVSAPVSYGGGRLFLVDTFDKLTAEGIDYFSVSEESEHHVYLLNADLAHTNRVLEWIRKDQLNNALGECKYVLDRFPNHPRALILLETVANLLHSQSIPDLYYAKALKHYPQYALTHAQYGKYLAGIGRRDEAIDQLKKAIELEPSLPVAHVWLAEAYFLVGKTRLATQEVSQARALGYQGEVAGETKAMSGK